MIKKISLVFFIIFIFVVVYFRFFIFSYDLDGNKIPPNVPSYYTDNYLRESGFITKIDSFETWYYLGKKDIYTWNINQKSFTDSMTLCLDTANEIKPLYFNFAIRMNASTDSAFRKEMNFQEPDSVLDHSFSHLNGEYITTYYKLDGKNYLERIFYKQDNVLIKIEYRYHEKKLRSNTISDLQWYESQIVKFLYSLTS